MIDLRTRLIMIGGSLFLLLLIIDLVRRRKLKEEYSVLWVAAGIGLFILACWYQLLDYFTTLIGGETGSSTLFFSALIFVFVLLLHYSVRISYLERRLTALVQEIALLSAGRQASVGVEVEELESAHGSEPAEVVVELPDDQVER